MVSQEEIRRARLEAMRRSGALELLEARLEALRAGVDPALVARVTADYYAGRLTPAKAARLLRRLASRSDGQRGK